MLAVLTDKRFSDPDWIFERKLDGMRCLAFGDGDDLRLLSRTRHALNATFPEVAEALLAQEPKQFVVDGEIVAFERNQTSFARLQRRLGIQDPERARRTGVAVFYYLFDILHLEGHKVSVLPVRERKAILRNAFSFEDPLRFTAHRDTDGERFYAQACHDGWEGLIAKRAAAPYQHKRSRDWLKFKCVAGQEFVIGGYTDPGGKRIGFGALLVGYYDDGGRLRYAGKVGTGYNDLVLRDLGARLAKLEQPEPPFSDGDDLPARAHWVAPELVAQVGFTELTRDLRLRHPRYLGLREDKKPHDVVLERPS
jgi:DNA ligase D-like protein (predicted ligase)